MSSYYFAYGADLDPDDLGLRCETKRRQRVRFATSVPGVLKGFRLVCNIPSRYRQGGIFNVIPDPAGVVHGAVYTLHAGDSVSVAIMKEGEGANYLLAINSVHTAKDKTVQALVLRAEAKSKVLQPAPTYLQVVIRAAQRHRLPPEWIAYLQSLKS